MFTFLTSPGKLLGKGSGDAGEIGEIARPEG
jgi:hypothetical protein